METKETKWRIYVDWPWGHEARAYGAPFRANIHTKHWFIMVGAKSQRWDSKHGYGDEFRYITWSPKQRCDQILDEHVRCPLRLGHKTDHWNWREQKYQPL